MELGDYEKSKHYILGKFYIDPVILEKSGLINECKWAKGMGIEEMPHTSENSKHQNLIWFRREKAYL